MQRTIWEWLGIEKTTDKSRIRKAYTEQVKKYHPEEFPEEAQELRKAYKDAMALASAARIAPEWADGDIEQGISFVVRDLVHASTESSGSDLPPETDAEAEPEYDYTKTVPPGEPPEPGAESKPEYVYKKTVPPGEPPEPDAEAKPEYDYTKTMPPGEQSAPAPETEHEYSFASPELPHGMAMRIADLKKRMDAIYGTDHRNFAEKWRRAFADYPYPRDLRDIRAVWEIFTAIEPMSRLNGATWDILQTELFRYQEDTAPWHLLQERFEAVRRSYVAPAQTPVRTPPKKTSLTEFCAALIILLILIGLLILIQGKVQELKQRQRLQEYQQMISEQMQLGNSAVPVSRGILQNVYTKEFPCEMDLNQDEILDHMYYDSDEGLFMVELYNPSTGTYNLYGSVDQYLEENPEMDSIKGLGYFTCGGKSLR